MISNVNSLAIVTSSICETPAIVTSHWSIILTLYLWALSSPQWRCQPGRFSMAAHRHDRRGIYRCVLLRFRGRIEIDHSYGLRCRGLCCHSRHSTRGAGRHGRKRPRDGRPHSCCAGSGSTNHSSADRIVVNSYNYLSTDTLRHASSPLSLSRAQHCSVPPVATTLAAWQLVVFNVDFHRGHHDLHWFDGEWNTTIARTSPGHFRIVSLMIKSHEYQRQILQ